MPVQVLNQTVTDNYKDTEAGLHSAFYGYGTFIVVENPVAVLMWTGRTGGQARPQEYSYLPPGTYPLTGYPEDWIVGLQFKNSVAAQTPAAKISCWLYEPRRAGITPSAVVNP